MSNSLDDYKSDNSDESYLMLLKQRQTANSATPAASRAPSTPSRALQQTSRRERTSLGAPRDASLPSAADESRREALRRFKNCERSRRRWTRIYADQQLYDKKLAERRVKYAAKQLAARRAKEAAKRRRVESPCTAARHRDRLHTDPERRVEALAKESREYPRARDAAKPRRDGSPCAAARHRTPVHAARERRAAVAARCRVRYARERSSSSESAPSEPRYARRERSWSRERAPPRAMYHCSRICGAMFAQPKQLAVHRRVCSLQFCKLKRETRVVALRRHPYHAKRTAVLRRPRTSDFSDTREW